MNRRLIGVQGSPSRGHPRLEIETETALAMPGDGSGSLPLAKLYETDAADTSDVYRARLVWGGFVTKVALELQRADAALTREANLRIAAEFDRKAALHRKLKDAAGVALLYDIAPGYASQYGLSQDTAPELPPSILCRNACHALIPRCPSCFRPLYSDVLSESDSPRRLICLSRKCETALKTYRATDVLKASVKNDKDACAACPHREGAGVDVCLENARFLNHFSIRFLVFERCDLDLKDYLTWPERTEPPSHRAEAWSRWRDHQSGGADLDAGEAKLARLSRTVAIFLDLLEGVSRVHELREPTAHLNLNPRTVGLQLFGASASARLLDLGRAVDDEAGDHFRSLPLRSPLSRAFAAPEVQGPSDSEEYPADARTHQESLVISLAAPPGDGNPTDPPFAPGDEIQFAFSGGKTVRARILQLRREGERLFLRARPFVQLELSRPVHGRMRSWKAQGPAAGAYSLGLILLALVLNRLDVSDVRGQLNNISAWLGARSRADDHPGFELVFDLLGSNDGHFRTVFGPILRKLSTDYGEWAFLGAELLSVALRCCVRGVPGYSVALDRGGGQPGLLTSVADHARRVQAATGAERDRRRVMHGDRSRLAERIEDLIGAVGYTAHDSSRSTQPKPAYDSNRLRALLLLAPPDAAAGALIRSYKGRRDWALDDLRGYLKELMSNSAQ
jgi:hypothetical protein